ncbi:MAG TPA: response regulator [Acidimicrobiia bacterium]|nr:response regulator [Acidimicrobiia bacterium]
MTRLLLVEDEPQLRRALSVSLRARGYEIEAAASGEEALQRVVADAPDGVVLDLAAAGIGGVELVRLLRESTAAPIVLISAREQEPDKVAALDAGADDYVTKPFGMGELLARLRGALAVRPTTDVNLSEWVETPDFVLDVAARRVYARGEEVPLTPAEWRLVEVLVGHRGQLVLECRLLEELSGPEGEPGGLRRCMARIRGKLEPDPARPIYFLAEPGLGYRFLVPQQDCRLPVGTRRLSG